MGDSKVADFQGIQWMIADLAIKLQTAQLVRDKAAWMEDAGLKHETETAMAKILAVELVDAAANKAFSIVGGYGSYRTDIVRALSARREDRSRNRRLA